MRNVRKKNPGKSKVIACAAAAAVIVSMTAVPAFAAEKSGSNIKDETVYVVTESDGSESDIIVSDHLKNNESLKTIKDVSSLTDIENVKGEETFDKGKNNSVSWNAAGNDIYYQGKTDKSAPVSLDIKYYLNGKEIAGKALDGKSGKIRIVINYKNHESVNIDGKNVNVPFVVLTGMVIDNECFGNITVSSGKVIDDGEKSFIIGMAAPGVAESLGVSESELGFGNTVEITGDAKEFSLEDMMSVVTNDFFRDINTDKISGMNMDAQIGQLDSAAKELLEGTNTLYQGVKLLSDSSEAFNAGVSALNDGARELDSGTAAALEANSKLAAGAQSLSSNLSSSLEAMKNGVNQLKSGSRSIYDGLSGVQAGVNGDGSAGNPGLAKGAQQLAEGLQLAKDTLYQGIKADESALAYIEGLHTNSVIDDETYGTLKQMISGSKQVQEGVSAQLAQDGQLGAGADSIAAGLGNVGIALNGVGTADNPGLVAGAKSVYDGITSLSGNLDKATANSGSLTSGANSLSKGADELLNGQRQITDGAQQLAAGMSKLNTNSMLFANGINKLDLGSKALNTGMKEFYEEGISKIVSLYNDKLKGTVNNADALIKAGSRYDTFTQVPNGMSGTVKFIYKTKISD